MSVPSRILCLNSGSSSLKLALYEDETRVASVTVERIGGDGGRVTTRDAAQRVLSKTPGVFPDTPAAVRAAFSALDAGALPAPDAVGHRVVHGGPDHVVPERVTVALVAALRALAPFAPLHLQAAVAGIEGVSTHFGGVPQVACFDTAFHRRMPEVSQRLPLPRALWAKGIRRYGFHGLSYEYIVATVGAATLGRAVIAHLGNGASMAAVRDGLPVDTTMGFTPTGGFMMGTRSGDLDPGVLLHLLAHERYDVAALERLVDREAGLLGVSGITADMKTLLAVRQHEPAAARAYRARDHAGATMMDVELTIPSRLFCRCRAVGCAARWHVGSLPRPRPSATQGPRRERRMPRARSREASVVDGTPSSSAAPFEARSFP